MTRYKPKMLLSLLLALVCIVTIFPLTALAADETELAEPQTDEIICTDENCIHKHDELEAYDAQPDTEFEVLSEPVAETAEGTSEASEPEPTAEASPTSGSIGDSDVTWSINAYNWLMIDGSGDCETFTSKDDQPWAAYRGQITAVWFDGMATLEISNLAYWFDGCTALETAEVPYTTSTIGTRAFAECHSLQQVSLYYSGSFHIEADAFEICELTPLMVLYNPDYDAVLDTLAGYNWTADNRAAYFEDVYGVSLLATGYCSNCGQTCSYTLAYEQWTDSVHCIRHWCSNCGLDQCGGVNAGSHSFSHYNSSYDRCSYCGYLAACTHTVSCSHSSTYTTWSGCSWYRYCSSCGVLVSSGVSHGTYVYGDWEYYNASQHRRLYACQDCGSGSYSYANHSTTTVYSYYSSTLHSVRQYCAACGSYVGSTSYATHALSTGAWASISDTQHQRTLFCSCGYRTTETASHSLTYSAWLPISDTQHQRTWSCSCGYSTKELGAHTDADNDGYCDNCSLALTRFSVTVPASLSMTVSKYGEVYSSDSAAIVNNSTGAVEVTGITVSTANGWMLAPYSTNMANVKVDTKLIGFTMNGARSCTSSVVEDLTFSGDWRIASGSSLSLSYDAVVSAMSEPVNEQVLTIVFVLDWA